MARSMESLTTIAMQQRQQLSDDDDGDDDRRTLDRLASFAAISDTSVASRRRLLQHRHLATGRRLSFPDTIKDIRTADSYVIFYTNFVTFCIESHFELWIYKHAHQKVTGLQHAVVDCCVNNVYGVWILKLSK